MNLNARQLAFLKHEMQQIKDDPDRDLEDRNHASSLLGRAEADIQHEKQKKLNEVPA